MAISETNRGNNQMQVRLAVVVDKPDLEAIYADVGSWLHDVKGITDQWPRRWGTKLLDRLIDARVLYVAELGSEIVGSFLYSDRGDAWVEKSRDAMYLGGLAVIRKFSGNGYGTELVKWAKAETERIGKQRLRLDCVASNKTLQNYYRSLGFRSVGEVENPDHLVLFEWISPEDQTKIP